MAVQKKTNLREAYQKFFKEKLRKYNVTSPSQIKNVTRKKQFFTEVQVDWQKRRRRIKDKEQLKAKYSARYLRAVKRRFNIGKSKLESGMLVELRYHTKNKTTGKNNPNKKYFVLILHPNYKKYVHCLRLDFVMPRYTKALVKEVGLVTCDALPACERLNVKQLLLEQKDSKKFYIKNLKLNMVKKYNSSYRTFKYQNVVGSSVYHFDIDLL